MILLIHFKVSFWNISRKWCSVLSSEMVCLIDITSVIEIVLSICFMAISWYCEVMGRSFSPSGGINILSPNCGEQRTHSTIPFSLGGILIFWGSIIIENKLKWFYYLSIYSCYTSLVIGFTKNLALKCRVTVC